MKTTIKKRSHALVPAGIATATAVVAGCLFYRILRVKHKEIPMPLLFRLTSPAFDAGDTIPATYTCKGANISPPLELAGTPDQARSLAMVLRDPDAPGGDFVHWTIWNIHPNITRLVEGVIPMGAEEGQNDFGEVGYSGPCPPSGMHHYKFELYALDSELDLPTGTGRQAALDVIVAHAIGKTELIGTVAAR